MSFRLRMTLLFTGVLSAVILIIGFSVYSLVSYQLRDQLDGVLLETRNRLINSAEVNSFGKVTLITLTGTDFSQTIIIQLWDQDGQLIDSSDNIRLFQRSIDPEQFETSQIVFNDVWIETAHLRVMSSPLILKGKTVGVLQVGTSLAPIDTTQDTLISVLLITLLGAVAIATILGGLVIRNALKPLVVAKDIAVQISNADDLSRRIPYKDPGGETDEIGEFINAFNQTLGRLEKLFSAQRRFMADVSHELRTPLTVINGNVGLMRRMRKVDEESLASIEEEVERLTRLVGDLLLLAQAESGKIPLDIKPVELDALLLEVYQQLCILAGDRVVVKLADIDQVKVMGDRDRLKQVVINLGANAINYTQDGGVVQLGLSKANGQAKLLVTDNGPGIDPVDLPHIFERFYRGEKSRTRKDEESGFGLGLSIAYWIVGAHGGRIEVSSKIGEGSNFCVWLPLDDTKGS
jgi:two-component system, OmpR family, sensor kinase